MDPTTLALMMGAAGGSGGPTVEYIGATQAARSSTANNFTIDKPANTQQGDLMVALMCSDRAGTVTWSGDTGWTEAVDQSSRPNVRIAHKVAGASEGASYTFSTNNSSRLAGSILTFRGAAWDAFGTVATNTTQTASAITVASTGSILIGFFASEIASVSWSNPTEGMVSTVTNTDATAPSYAIYLDNSFPAGSSGDKSAAPSNASGNLGCILLSVKPL